MFNRQSQHDLPTDLLDVVYDEERRIKDDSYG